LSEQLPPIGIGDAATQFWVEKNCPVALTLETCNGPAPVFVSVTVLGALVVPIDCGANVRLDGETDATGSAAEPMKTYAASWSEFALIAWNGAPIPRTRPSPLSAVEAPNRSSRYEKPSFESVFVVSVDVDQPVGRIANRYADPGPGMEPGSDGISIA